MSEPKREILIAAAILLNEKRQMLVVRKRGTTQFMQPGGKIDPGETPEQALRRELAEEIGLTLPENAARMRASFARKPPMSRALMSSPMPLPPGFIARSPRRRKSRKSAGSISTAPPA